MRYTHDCDNCKPLGEYARYDLYFCPSTHAIPTLVARFSSDGPDYISGLEFRHTIPCIGEAYRRAVKQNLISA